MQGNWLKTIFLALGSIICLAGGTLVFAGDPTTSAVGVALVAKHVVSNLSDIAKLITACAYVAGMGFVTLAVVKFKGHKDNPTQVTISQPIALLFIGAALLFAPSVFTSSGQTLFSTSGSTGGISGVDTFDTGGTGGGTK